MWFGLLSIGLGFLFSILFPPKPVKQYGPRLSDTRVTTSTYGEAIKKGWGSCRWGGNYIWVEGNKLTEKKKKSESGGVITITYHYSASFAVSWGAGPITAIRRIWFNDKLIYSVMDDNDDVVKKIAGSMTHYLGDETQTADPYMVSVEGASKVPAYRGQAYTVFKNVNLDEFYSKLPDKVEAEVVADGDIVNDYETFALPVNPNTNSTIYLKPWDMPIIVYAVGGSILMVVDIYDTSIVRYFPTSESGIGGGDWCIDFLGHYYAWGFGAYGIMTIPLVKFSKDFKYLGWTVDYQGVKAGTDQPSGGYCASFINYMGASLPYIWILGGVSGTVIEGVQPFVFEESIMGTGEPIDFDGDMWMTYLLYIPNPASTGYDCDVIQGTIDKNGDCWAICAVPAKGHTGGFLLHCTLPPVIEGLDALFIPYFGYEKYDISPTDLEYPEYVTYLQDESNEYLIVGGQHNAVGRLIKFSVQTKTVVGTLDFSALLDVYTHSTFKNGLSSDGIFWLGLYDGDIVEIDCNTFTIKRQDSTANFGILGDPPNVIYNEESQSLWGLGTNIGWRLSLDRVTANKATLSSIVTGITEGMGLAVADIDVSDLTTTTVDGFSVTGDTTGRNAIETLQSAYFFDGVESDWKLNFPIRTGTSIGTILEDDLSARILDDAQPAPILTNREIDLDLPQTIEIKYIDIDGNHENRTQFSTREPGTVNSRNRESIELPIVMDKDIAKQISEKLLYLTWKQKEGLYELTLPWKYLKYDPADVVTVPYKNTNYLLRLIEVQLGANLLMQCKALPEADYCYVSNAVGTVPNTNVGVENENLKNSKGKLDPYFLDIALINDWDDDCGFYLAARSSYYWYGAKTIKSDDGISNFDQVGWQKNEGVIGQCTEALGTVESPATFDLANTLTIRLYDSDSTLIDATEAEVLNGSNQCLVGDEIIRFMNATDNGDGTWTIATLLRGLRGTEWAISSHIFGDRFVMLNDKERYDRIKLWSGGIEETKYYAIMPPDGSRADHQVLPFVCNAIGKKPYAPCDVIGTRDNSNNLTITWKRRTRIGGEWQDYSDVPLGEETKSYEIDIYDGATVVRTITATTESTSYTAAQQTTDGLTPGDPVDLIAYQVSATIDRGYGTTKTV